MPAHIITLLFDPETEMFHDEELSRFLLNKRVNKGSIKQRDAPGSGSDLRSRKRRGDHISSVGLRYYIPQHKNM